MCSQLKNNKRQMVGNNYNAANRKSVSIDGVIYPSVYQAALQLEISRTTVRQRLDSKHFTNYFYISKDNQP